MSPPHVLIAGAGIGGLTAALALARRGVSVTLAEKRTAFAEAGAGIQISPNAGRVLEALDLGIALRRISVTAGRLVVRRWCDGRELVEMPMSDAQMSSTSMSDAQMSAPKSQFRLLHRADLHQILLDAARAMPNLRLVVGRGLDSVRETDTGIEAILTAESGESQTIAAIALVGADGLWSRTRTLTGDKSPPRFTGYEAWRALVPAGREPAEISLHLGDGRHSVSYPVAAGRLLNLVIVRKAAQAHTEWSRQGEPSVLASILADAAPALRSLAGRAPEWRVWSLHDRPPAAMAHGRLALLGDAAHPVLPFLAQGAALAIEDAAVLADRLCAGLETGGTSGVPAALAAYAAARGARVARIRQASLANGRAYHLPWPLSMARDFALRRLGPQGMRARHDWVYDWRDGSG